MNLILTERGSKIPILRLTSFVSGPYLPLLKGSWLCRLVSVSDDTVNGKLDKLHVAAIGDRLKLDHCVQGHLQPRQFLLTGFEIIGEQTSWEGNRFMLTVI